MNFIDVIGIDVSKKVIDVCIHSNQFTKQFHNTKTGLKKFIHWAIVNSASIENTLFVLEHTGMYSHLISKTLNQRNFNFYMASGLDIKRSMGITRGKSDFIDAKRIALYGYRLKDEINPTKTPSNSINTLKSLKTLRNQLIKQRRSFKNTLNEQKEIFEKKDFKTIFSIQEKMILYLTKQIKKVDNQIQIVIDQNQELKNNFELVKSVKCIGDQMAITLIITTENFTKFDTWRKFASYAGIAPFPNQSGSSIRGKSKVSHLANKDVKATIHLCALSAIKYNPEMRKYYLNRIKNGKNKMSTVNILRNKLIARVFAVIKRQTPYVNTIKFAS